MSFVLEARANAFDIPTRQSFLSELVGKGPDLANAIALNSSVFNGARLVGPALAGLLLALTSPGVCFLANGAQLPGGHHWPPCCYAHARGAANGRAAPATPGRLISGLREGLAYAWRSPPIRSLLLLIGVFNMAGMAETTLLPIITTAVLDGAAPTLEFPFGRCRDGSICRWPLFLASRRSVPDLAKWIALAPAAFGLAVVAFSFANSLWAAALLLTATGFALLLMTAAANTVLQSIVEEDKRGRVVSFYTMMVTGLAPIGGLFAGFLADGIGAPLALRLAGLGCLVEAIPFALQFYRKTVFSGTSGI